MLDIIAVIAIVVAMICAIIVVRVKDNDKIVAIFMTISILSMIVFFAMTVLYYRQTQSTVPDKVYTSHINKIIDNNSSRTRYTIYTDDNYVFDCYNINDINIGDDNEVTYKLNQFGGHTQQQITLTTEYAEKLGIYMVD